MTQFVFLPNKDADKTQAAQTLASSLQGKARLAVNPQQASLSSGRYPTTTFEAVVPMLASMTVGREAAHADEPEVAVLDMVEQSGAMLLQTSEAMEMEDTPHGQIVPVQNYVPAIADVRFGRSRMKLFSGPAATNFLTIKLKLAGSGAPVAGAVANLRLVGQQEINAVSDANGKVTFGIRVSNVTRARLMVEPGFAGHWGFSGSNMTISNGDTIQIDEIDLAASPDALRNVIAPGAATDGRGVRVGVIDSGVGPHPDLANASGDADTSIGHGSHVAGIIGGQGGSGTGGVAPGVEMLSYRVFDDPATGVARNFDIHRAIEQAVDDGCHLINLSLKSENPFLPAQNDFVISRAIEDAADAGVLCVAAAGNDFRRFVAFPARHADALAVSAFGWEPGMPANAFDAWTMTDDRADSDDDLFFANFSNEGVDNTEVDLTGPGAGIISTVPGDTYAPMSGTSMACPAAVGAIAKLLSADGNVLDMDDDRDRYDRIREIAVQGAAPLGFGNEREGSGFVG